MTRVAVVTAALLALLPAGLLAQAVQSPPSTQRSVRSGVTVSRDTVTIGEPFEVRVRVRAPAEARIQFPDNPDTTTGTVHARDPRAIATTDSIAALDQTATYRMAAWDVGEQPIRLGDVVVTWNEGNVTARRTVSVSDDRLFVFVRSVLPLDTALRDPKPARPLWEPAAFPWWILAVVLAALVAALLVWWWLRRRKRAPAPVRVDPYVAAMKELNRIEALGLVDAGERTRFASLVVEVLRDYFAARYSDVPQSLTSRELVAALRRRRHPAYESIGRLLHEVDLVKFARWALSDERAHAVAHDARTVIERDHQASRPSIPRQERAA